MTPPSLTPAAKAGRSARATDSAVEAGLILEFDDDRDVV